MSTSSLNDFRYKNLNFQVKKLNIKDYYNTYMVEFNVETIKVRVKDNSNEETIEAVSKRLDECLTISETGIEPVRLYPRGNSLLSW